MAIERKASAIWTGDLRSGNGSLTTASGTLSNTQYNFSARFESGVGTNPEELIAAAHAGCYSMAFGNALGKLGFKVGHIDTTAVVVLGPKADGSGSAIQLIKLHTEGSVEGVDAATFAKVAEETKAGCIVSQALSAVPMELEVKLLS